MDLLEMVDYHAIVDKAQGVMLGSAAVQILADYATEITLGITFFSFLIMWFYKHRSNKQDQEYKRELLRIKKGRHLEWVLTALEDHPEISAEQFLKIKKDLQGTLSSQAIEPDSE